MTVSKIHCIHLSCSKTVPAFLKNYLVQKTASLRAFLKPFLKALFTFSRDTDMQILDFAGEVRILCKAIKSSFKYENPYFAAIRFFISCLRLSEDIKIWALGPLNQVLTHSTG